MTQLHLSATTGREHFVEIWDLGGSARYDKARPLFYTPVPDGPHCLHAAVGQEGLRS